MAYLECAVADESRDSREPRPEAEERRSTAGGQRVEARVPKPEARSARPEAGPASQPVSQTPVTAPFLNNQPPSTQSVGIEALRTQWKQLIAEVNGVSKRTGALWR